MELKHSKRFVAFFYFRISLQILLLLLSQFSELFDPFVTRKSDLGKQAKYYDSQVDLVEWIANYLGLLSPLYLVLEDDMITRYYQRRKAKEAEVFEEGICGAIAYLSVNFALIFFDEFLMRFLYILSLWEFLKQSIAGVRSLICSFIRNVLIPVLAGLWNMMRELGAYIVNLGD